MTRSLVPVRLDPKTLLRLAVATLHRHPVRLQSASAAGQRDPIDAATRTPVFNGVLGRLNLLEELNQLDQ